MKNPATTRAVPSPAVSCDDLASGEMWHYWRDHFNHPPLFNDLGSFRTGPDIMGIHNFMFPPFSGNGEGTAMLYIDRQHPASCDVKVGYTWYPDRVRRRAVFQGLEIETTTRALPDRPGALILLEIKNPHVTPRRFEVAIKMAGRLLNTIDGWASIGPSIGIEDEQREKWTCDLKSGSIVFLSGERAWNCQGTLPKPDAIDGKTCLYNVTLAPGETWRLRFAATLGESEAAARKSFDEAIHRFDFLAAAQRKAWEDKINKAFQPGNDLYSGHLPWLQTENDDLRRLYLMTTVGCLVLRRDNPLSRYGPAYVTLSPNYWTTASFLWDMMIAAPFYAMLDPALLRNHIEVWLGADIRGCLATDYVTGRPLGNWYAVNSTAIVRLAHDYLRYTGDLEWLDRHVHGKTIIEHLEEHALIWHEYDRNGHGLADCGGVINLLECVSTYTHEVAAFNAMWVAALRQVASMRRLRNQEAIAVRLEQDAEKLLRNLLSLYADTKGYWRCKQPDGTYNEVHHIYDFVAVLESIAGDLPENIRREMVANFREEHMAENWTRSLSAWDDDAHRALRVDHQWTGSFASISAQAINGLYKVGEGSMAFDWLRNVALVAHQGPIGQAHWVPPLFPSYKGGAWKCSYLMPFITDWTVAANGAYPAMIVESVFGVQAPLSGGLRHGGVSPGLEPEARLENLPYQGRNYNVDRNGIAPAD